MKSTWLQYTTLRAASLLAPGDQRAEWLEGWRSELWYVPRRGATLFCLGAFRDALWLRRNNLSPGNRSPTHLKSPLSCLAFLAALAAVSILISVLLPAPRTMTAAAHLRARDLPEGCVAMLLLSCGFLPAMRVAMGHTAARPHPVAWRGRLRLGIFLTLKIALLQPIMLCGFIAYLRISTAPLAPALLCASWILACRWALIDQRRRCPVCLRLLSNPVRIGSPSETFLEWYGAESVCSRGHGLLQSPEISASYSQKAQWLCLDGSWSGLFPEASGGRK
jgi:hypothetical protein